MCGGRAERGKEIHGGDLIRPQSYYSNTFTVIYEAKAERGPFVIYPECHDNYILSDCRCSRVEDVGGAHVRILCTQTVHVSMCGASQGV